MKKINSINYGGKVLGLGCFLAFVIPAAGWLGTLAWNSKFLHFVSIISGMIGIVILVLFFIHLMIELHQDRKIDRYYSSCMNRKLLLTDGHYECSSCGNRKLNKSDEYCPICGEKFSSIDLSPQEILDGKKVSAKGNEIR